MWRLVLTVSLLCCSSEGSVTCRDEGDNPVDWYILYKTPRIKIKGLDGLDYIYIYPGGTKGKTVSQLNKKDINDPNGVLANTLQPLFKFDKNNPPQGFGFISYNDGVPKGYPKSVSDTSNTEGGSAPDTFGHSKGVVMVEKIGKGGKGVWLLHSTPQFPNDRKPNNFWPKSGARNAQTFICVTFNYEKFEHIGEHLQYIRAFPFDHHIPQDFHKTLQEVTTMNTKIHSTPKQRRFNPPFQQLISSREKEFRCIAKQVSADGKPEDGDLYFIISQQEEVKSHMIVQSWGCQPDRDGSFCSENKWKVENIQSVKLDEKWGEWDSGSDHSKWCVAVDQNKPWTCIADVNRSESQYNRLGGALCINDEKVTNIFKGFIRNVEKCPEYMDTHP